VAKRRAIRAASKEDGFFDGEGDSALTWAGVILISELACAGGWGEVASSGQGICECASTQWMTPASPDHTASRSFSRQASG